jgi:WbqC-like protein family
MQPYFFPYVGHFGLIAAVDEWIVFDITQYARKSWINRNRILHPTEGWQYVSAPLAKSTTRMTIHEAQVADPSALHQSLLGKLGHYRKTAPYFAEVKAIVDNTFAALEGDSLVALNVAGLKMVCAYLDLPFRYRICSELNLAFPDEMGPGDWAPAIARQLGASCYVNPSRGRELFQPSDFTDHGIELRYAEFGEFTYETPGYTFVPGLSILDALMWVDADRVRRAARELTALVA